MQVITHLQCRKSETLFCALFVHCAISAPEDGTVGEIGDPALILWVRQLKSNHAKPMLFVLFNNDLAYPEYIIIYRRETDKDDEAE